MLKYLNTLLNTKRKGSSSFEWVCTVPLTVVLVGITIIMSVLIISWVNYGSCASVIAKDMNFRQTGLQAANEWIQANQGRDGGINFQVKNSLGKMSTIHPDTQVTVNGSSAASPYRNAVVYHMNEQKQQFAFPYTDFENIDVSIKRVTTDGTFDTVTPDGEGQNLSNNLVKVSIHYRFMPVRVQGIGGGIVFQMEGLHLTSEGYSVIT